MPTWAVILVCIVGCPLAGILGAMIGWRLFGRR